MNDQYRKHRRKSLRLPGYNYAQPGSYFVTICVHNHNYEMGVVKGGQVILNAVGNTVQRCWNDLSNHYRKMKPDEFVIMPNHMHLILELSQDSNDVTALPEIIRALKSFSARDINRIRHTIGQPFWQRNYYERIIRNTKELVSTREYIRNNPLAWNDDVEHLYYQHLANLETIDNDRLRSAYAESTGNRVR